MLPSSQRTESTLSSSFLVLDLKWKANIVHDFLDPTPSPSFIGPAIFLIEYPRSARRTKKTNVERPWVHISRDWLILRSQPGVGCGTGMRSKLSLIPRPAFVTSIDNFRWNVWDLYPPLLKYMHDWLIRITMFGYSPRDRMLTSGSSFLLSSPLLSPQWSEIRGPSASRH